MSLVSRLFLPLVLISAVASTTQDKNDWLIVPGTRIGPINAKTVRADLVRSFGARFVSDGEIALDDGESETGTLVYGDQPDKTLGVLWDSDEPNAHVRRVLICQTADTSSGCRWHTPEGVTVGSTLRLLEKINGRPFKLNGFDWGIGGLVTDWNGGRLESMVGPCSRITVRLDPQPGDATEERSRVLERAEENIEFWSSDPLMQQISPAVDHLSFAFLNCSK